jgi:hypothetical protein
MNYIKHLTGFFDRVSEDWTLNPTHISLYIALFHYWNTSRFQNPISLTRGEVMRISKISSKATYHKCIKDLNDKGYIKYEPSNNPFKGSLATLFDFSDYLKPVQKKAISPKKNLPNNELVMNKQRTGNETSTETSNEQALVSSINYTNITNNSNIQNDLNLEEQAKNSEEINNSDLKNKNLEKEKSSAKKEKEMPEQLLFENQKSFSPAFADYNKKQTEHSRQKSSAKKEKESVPTIEKVKSYFLQQNFPELEANKFFNYFSSIGWLVGGKTPMVDWQAAAQNWMLNAIKFKTYEKPPDRAKHLNTENDKDYGEPL